MSYFQFHLPPCSTFIRHNHHLFVVQFYNFPQSNFFGGVRGGGVHNRMSSVKAIRGHVELTKCELCSGAMDRNCIAQYSS